MDNVHATLHAIQVFMDKSLLKSAGGGSARRPPTAAPPPQGQKLSAGPTSQRSAKQNKEFLMRLEEEHEAHAHSSDCSGIQFSERSGPHGSDKRSGKHMSERSVRTLPRLSMQEVEIQMIQRRAQAFRDLKYKPGCMIDPRTSRLMPRWDVWTSIALVFTALVTPYEVGFLPASRSPLDPLFLINRIVDLTFFIDLCLQFFLMYPLNEGREGARGIRKACRNRNVG